MRRSFSDSTFECVSSLTGDQGNRHRVIDELDATNLTSTLAKEDHS